ncbi:MAG: hypothetical protein RBT78_13075, partial [Kiritimatiellia bacterium]|nr:hypothetical protein [Kiritimatiellia bacterium]
MALIPPDFDALCDAVMEGRASPDEVSRFRTLVEMRPACLERYRCQMEVDVLLTCVSGGRSSIQTPPTAVRKRVRAVAEPLRGRFAARRLPAVAAAAVALLGVGVWHASRPSPRTGTPHAFREAGTGAVPLVRTLALDANARRLDLPASLPGRLRLESGIARVCLPS